MTYIQHMKQDRLDAEVDEIRDKIKSLCEEAYKLLEDLPEICEPDDSNDIQHNINAMNTRIKRMANIKQEVEKLENSIPYFPEAYDVEGNR